METKKKSSLEKESLTDDQESSQSIIKKIYLILRSNWIPLAFALLICLIVIVVVPIIYSIDKHTTQKNDTILSWNSTGITIINQRTFIQGSNLSIGIISSIQFDSDSNLYLLDQTNHRLLKYVHDQQSSSLLLIVGYLNGTNGSDFNSLNSPNDFLFQSSNLILIVDTNNHRILSRTLNTQQGNLIFGTGQMGSTDKQLNRPMSLTMDLNSNLYIADYGNNRLIKYNLITNQSQIYFSMNSPSQLRNTYISTPISIKYHQQTNSLVIAQQLGYNVIRWIIDQPNWTLICGSVSSELSGTSRTLFNQICSIDIDNQMNTYISDCQNQRIQFFQGDGTKGKTIAGVIQAIGNNSYIFNHPTAITLDQDRNLYVADSMNYRIQSFQRI